MQIFETFISLRLRRGSLYLLQAEHAADVREDILPLGFQSIADRGDNIINSQAGIASPYAL
jgi:hypothetical protein